MAEPASSPRPVERRLAAILAADVVGYSHLVEQDEMGTIARLKALRKDTLEPILAGHGGRVVKLMGDGAIVEFGSVVEAVQAAVECQRATAAHEAARPSAERIALRIGVNLGDIVLEPDGDILGDGVNIAARLEQLAEPGGICVSEAVVRGLRANLPVGLKDLGPQRLKNIGEPVRVYRLMLDGRRPAVLARHRVLRPALVAALALLVVVAAAAGGQWWWHGRADKAREATLGRAGSIAVLPFTNFSGDPRWERVADGVSEDIITDLAQQPELFVIARNSTFTYKGKSADVKQVGKELGVRFVLEGSLQADSGHVRITAQLIDATTGTHLWAERWDRPEGDLFAVQDEVAQKVTNTLANFEGQVARTSVEFARRKPPSSLDAYDLYLLGIEQKHTYTKQSSDEAIRLLKRAVELDPSFARAWLGLGFAYSLAATSGFTDDPERANRLGNEAVEKAFALDPKDALALAGLTYVRALEGDPKGAEEIADRAVALAPNNADVLMMTAWNLPPLFGRTEDAVRDAKRGLALNPIDVPSWYFVALGSALYYAGAYEEAIGALRRAPQHSGETLCFLAIAHAKLGQLKETQEFVARIQHEAPNFTAEGYIRDFPIIHPTAIAAFRDGATKAGLIPPATN